MDDCKNCPYEKIIAELQKDSERNSNQHREFYKRFSEVETLLAVQGERYSNLLTMMSEVKVAVEGLKEKPAKKWDAVSMYVITAVISAVIGGLIGKFV